MLSTKLHIILFAVVLFSLFINSKSDRRDQDIGPGDEELKECEYKIDFKTYKKTKKLHLCNTLLNSTSKSDIQLRIYANFAQQKFDLRAFSSSFSNSNKSLITLMTDILDNFKYSTALLVIHYSQLLSLSTLQSMVSSLINVDLNSLEKYLNKTLVVAKGGHKNLYSCSGNFYPKQDFMKLNIGTMFVGYITCTYQAQRDRILFLIERMHLYPANQKNFNLGDIHQDDAKKIIRNTWYMCNNPASCSHGVQNKKMLDKTVNYAVKFLQKARTGKKTSSG